MYDLNVKSALIAAILWATQAGAMGAINTSTDGRVDMSRDHLQGNWKVIEAHGVDISGFRDLTLRFTGTKLFGFAPCKSFTAEVMFDDKTETMLVSRFKSTPHICEADVMQQERKYLDLVRGIDTYGFDENDQLILSRYSGPILLAERFDN